VTRSGLAHRIGSWLRRAAAPRTGLGWTAGSAPRLVPAPAVRRALVLAPHMDDDVFGCGGTLARSAARGCAIRVVYLTDGSKGYLGAGAPGLTRSAAELRLVEQRKDEARCATKRLGVSELSFLDEPDGALAVSPRSTARLAELLADAEPELVYLPLFTDLHPDHRAASALFVAAARRARLRSELPCWAYEVWRPIAANALVDISETMAAKREAMHAFASQNQAFDYPRAIEGLNAYHSLVHGRGRGFAEAFFTAELGHYARLARRAGSAP
jgi:LmbE family N-acetylglucosaminyl deacetylase